jgi:hypothetical protein
MLAFEFTDWRKNSARIASMPAALTGVAWCASVTMDSFWV